MPLVFRKIKKSKWYKNDAVRWLGPDDLQADAIGDLKTRGNCLSVYFLEKGDDGSLERLVTGLAANRKDIEEFDYALFPDTAVSDLAIKVTSEEGDTPDSLVNSWHRNLVQLSAQKLFDLANVIRLTSTKQRVLGKRIRAMLIDGLVANQIARDKIKLSADIIADLETAALTKSN